MNELPKKKRKWNTKWGTIQLRCWWILFRSIDSAAITWSPSKSIESAADDVDVDDVVTRPLSGLFNTAR